MIKPEVYYHVSQSQLSMICRYGCTTVDGTMYYYDPVSDTAIREDIQAKEGWRVIRAGKDDEKDEYLGEANLTQKQAVALLKADRSGRACYLFGPTGVDPFSRHVNGEPKR